MIANFFRVFVAVVVVVAIAGVLGLVVMSGVAATHDVARIDVPPDSYLTPLKADYKDAYRAPMEFDTYKDIGRVAEFAGRKGWREVSRSDNEVAYEGSGPGIAYFVSYILDRRTTPNTLTMVTAVRVRDDKGRYFWRVFRPVYRHLAPYLLDRLARGAPD